MTTIYDINDNIFEPTFKERNTVRQSEATYDKIKDYVVWCKIDIEKKLKEIYPELKHQLKIWEHEPTQLFLLQFVVSLEDGPHYINNYFTWNPKLTDLKFKGTIYDPTQYKEK